MNRNDIIIAEFRENDGTVTTGGFGRHLVLLHHCGRSTGIERITPLFALRQDPDTWMIVATKAGAPEHPAWFHNLLAHPEVTIETPDDGTVAVRAEQVTDSERDLAWAKFVEVSPIFAQYQAKTERTIPVVALRRRT
ncbi:nitroreductase/quinone reductase family protein [Antrihabitans stalactiti]|uniref:Nitroreductase family deazaflavin-dependent oxidoreductase n=1 Tax=Antrihabitans stalactiti TaxID=2584121 RepID=A0A848KL66_9NOCA|nr:nitroreductase/quinone reductase family protein [Antrihabitans stalactiti]NMN99009.1 nitroreductase family deazaflavin-dependent oxidoreductase [Antrihabitans stalactiti]